MFSGEDRPNSFQTLQRVLHAPHPVPHGAPEQQETIELVQEQLDLEVMQELNARVSLDREDPADVAADYLQTAGYVE